jgi:hypothetical protein
MSLNSKAARTGRQPSRRTPLSFLGNGRRARADKIGLRDEAGAILILALVYIISISMVVGALADFAMNDLNNTNQFSSASTLHYAATSVTDVAIQTIRYTPIPADPTQAEEQGLQATPLGNCWTPPVVSGNYTNSQLTIDKDPVAVWCTTTEDLSTNNAEGYLLSTRAVTFYACPSKLAVPSFPITNAQSLAITQAAAACESNPYLTAVVAYNDYPKGYPANLLVQCNEGGTGQCGYGTTLETWTWGKAANAGVIDTAASMTFSGGGPFNTSTGVATGAAVTVSDASNNPVAGDTVTLSVDNGPGGFDASSIVSAITNASGVATFTSLILDTAGSYTLTASDGVVSANSSAFSVSSKPPQSVAFYTSGTFTSLITSASLTYGSAGTYQLYAKGSGNGTITFASTTPSICTVTSGGGLVTILQAGSCVVTADAAATSTYADSGTTNFTLTINPKPITVTAANQSIVYGGTFTNSVSSSGLVGTDTLSGATYKYAGTGSTTYGPSSTAPTSAGTYSITPSAATFSSGSASNYSITYAAGTLTITQTTPAGAAILGVPNPKDGTPDTGDQVVFTYNQVMSASSLLTGFNGSSTGVYGQLTRASGASTVLEICANSTCSTVVNLGTVNLDDQTGARYMASGTPVYLHATMTMATVSNQSVVTVTLGALISGTITAQAATTTLSWTPSNVAQNPSGTGCTTMTMVESTAIENF